MPTQDVLEIITATGDVQFYGLDPAKGVTNIGRHPDNDIVIESPDVAPFHAVLLHQRKPYQLTLLDPGGRTRLAGQPVTPNAPQTLHAWDTIELDGCSLVFMEDAAGASPAGPVIVRSGPGGISAPAIVPPVVAPPAPTAVPSPAAPTPVPPPPAPAQPPVPLALERSEHALAPPLPAAEGPLPPPSSFLLPSTLPVVDQADEVILASLSQREFTLNVEQVASFDVTLINGGDIVATLLVGVEGLNPAWVTISPPAVNLNEGERATVQVTITPPRLPSTRAGPHYFGLTVHSPNYPGRLSRTGAVLHVNPYYEYTVDEISPRQQNIPWRKRAGRASFSLANLGNSEVPYRLDAADDENACQFEFQVSENGASLAKQAEVRLAPEAGQTVGLTIAPLRRRFFGWSGHTHSVTVNVTPLEGLQTPRAVLAQAQSLPLIGPWHVFFLLLLAAILIALAFRPSVGAFSADPPEVLSSEIMGGKKVELSYRVSWFARASIDPQVGRLEGTQGAVEVAPTETTTYRITATDFLTFLYPPWFSDSREFTVVVDPVTPIVRFSVDKDQLIVGESATLSWEVLNAEVVVLKTNGAPETFPADRHTGSLQVSPQIETTYTLEARNAYTTGDGIVQTIIVNAVNPTPTPLPLPVIQRFDALPNPITAGDEVTLEWAVTGVDEVQIEPLGAFPPSGRTVVKPDQTTAYQLVASNGQAAPVRSLREVVVNPAPTATPVPGTPRIELFTASTTEAFLGSQEADNIQLAWSVTGEYANIELSSDTLGRISGLPAQGSRTVSVNNAAGDHKFILTANNGPERTASQTVTINVTVPVPAISGLSPSSAFVGGPSFTLVVAGANFLPGSTVRWNGVDRPTVFVSGFQLTATIPASDISETGVFAVTVFNPATAGGGLSAASTFKVNNPTPLLAAADPLEAVVGDPDLTITLTGTGFIPASVVRFNGAALQTTYSSPTELRAVLPKASMGASGTFTLTVFNPEPIGGSSGALTFVVRNPQPALTSLGPPSFVTVGGSAFTLTILGSGFVGGENGSLISWGGDVRQAIFINESQLQITIPAADLAQVKTVLVAVINEQPNASSSVSNFLPFEIRKNSTSVSVSASPVIGVTGQLVTFTAYVSPGPGALTGPLVGSVIFKHDGVEVATVPVSGDPASASFTRRFPAGNAALTAEYDGTNDPNFASSAFTPFNYTVGEANVRVTVSSNSPTSYGTGASLTATVTAADPGSNDPVGPAGGAITFSFDGGSLSGPIPIVNGVANFTTSGTAMPVGVRSITANYDGTNDPNFQSGASLPHSHTVTKPTPTVTLSFTSPTTYGQQVALTANVSHPLAGTPADGGIVTFKSGATTLGTGFLSGGTATFSTTATQFQAGGYSITAEFAGDSNFTSAVSPAQSLTVNRAPVTATLAPTSPDTTPFGTTINLSVSLSAGAAPPPPSGTVTIRYGTTTLAVVNVVGGSAFYTTTASQLSVGSYVFTATYNGEAANYAASSPSNAITHTVTRLTPTLTVVNSVTGTSGSFTLDSGGVYWSATVSGPGGSIPAPTGSVRFTFYSNYSTDHCYGQGSAGHNWWDFGPVNTTIPLAGGQAIYLRVLVWNDGAHQMQVTYLGDTNYNSVTSTAVISNNTAGVTCTVYNP